MLPAQFLLDPENPGVWQREVALYDRAGRPLDEVPLPKPEAPLDAKLPPVRHLEARPLG